MAIYLMPTDFPSTRIAPGYANDPTDTVWHEVVRQIRKITDTAARTAITEVERRHQLRERGRCCLAQVQDLYDYLVALEDEASEAKK